MSSSSTAPAADGESNPATAAGDTRRIKFVTGADSFGCALKDALNSHLASLGIPVEDIGVGPYYTIGDQIGRLVSEKSDSDTRTLGLVACGTGVGVQIFANKSPGVYAATCGTVDEAVNTRSINGANVLAVSGMYTSPDKAVEILDAFIRTPFKSPCPASENKDWSPEIVSFLDGSVPEMDKIGRKEDDAEKISLSSCVICDLVEGREFEPVKIMPGGEMRILRESPTSAIVRFKAGSLEPAHHHTFGHDLIVTKGKKKVWNLTKGEEFGLGDGDFLFTPAGDVHRVKYFEDTEFFIRWDGKWDIFLDEDLETARAEVEKVL
ncbi:hypothetical protein Droror1_Dr00023017 [Drosera rotundifolia]